MQTWSFADWSRVGLVIGVAGAAFAGVLHISEPATLSPGDPGLAAAVSSTTTGPAQPNRPSNRFAAQVPRFPTAPPPAPAAPPGGAEAPLLQRVDTTQPVAFITIDDGVVRHPDALELVRASGVPVSLFLVSAQARQDPPFFAGLRETGGTIQAHTVSHRILKGQPYEVQRREICDSADELARLFGPRPTLFRPPGGAYDHTTLRAAADCGMKAVFHWTQAVNNGEVQYQSPERRIRPGDVILMHFRDTFVEDYLATLRAIEASGLTPARLEDYVPA